MSFLGVLIHFFKGKNQCASQVVIGLFCIRFKAAFKCFRFHFDEVVRILIRTFLWDYLARLSSCLGTQVLCGGFLHVVVGEKRGQRRGVLSALGLWFWPDAVLMVSVVRRFNPHLWLRVCGCTQNVMHHFTLFWNTNSKPQMMWKLIRQINIIGTNNHRVLLRQIA